MKENNYSLWGMSIGMCFGCALGATNIIDIGTGMSLGLIFGLLIGMFIRKSE